MRMVDIIARKRSGQPLSREEIREVIQGFSSGEIPDYQMSALAMAICFQGMSDWETTELTLAMAESGQMLNWADIPGVKVDKHSTGGVGDTTTLVLAPLVASVGVPIAKMSGRGLGHTGGTIDKLESIPGFSTDLSMADFRKQVQEIGVAVAGQTADLAPADKRLYALRDVTGTVESLPLIASSIMSKKLASGADAIVLDVKVGTGAFMKTFDEARELAQRMVSIGHNAGRRVSAVITQMEQPLGKAIGNALEVREAIMTLRGQGPEDLTELCLVLGSEMVVLAGKADNAAKARKLLEQALSDGSALAKLKQWLIAQGGDARVADDLSLLPKSPVIQFYHAQKDGVIESVNAQQMGVIAMRLGAGRAAKDDVIDPSVGLVLLRKVGQRAARGEALVEIHAASTESAQQALKELDECIVLGDVAPYQPPLVLDVVHSSLRPQPVEEGDPAKVNTAQVMAGESKAEAVSTTNLVEHAKQARELAYVPYSHFAVGAALRLSNGEVVTGANVENASYGLTNCAERTAVFKAVTEKFSGTARIIEVAVVADSPDPVAPCGACRQVLREFCDPGTPVLLANLHGAVKQTTVEGLLPYSFTAAQMESGENLPD